MIPILSASFERFVHSSLVCSCHQVLLLAFACVLAAGWAPAYAAPGWHLAASMKASRYIGQAATLLPNGKVLITGGGAYFDDEEIYDPVIDSWKPAGRMRASRNWHTATLLPSGKVLVAGGSFDAPSTTELYDPASNTWTYAAPLLVGRTSHTATLLANGKVLVTGGEEKYGNNTYASAELYDPASNTWSGTANMRGARTEHTATLLADGRVLVVGGLSNATAEIYDPTTETWSSAGSVLTKRMQHQAVRLPNGKVLVVGGTSGLGSYPSNAELYDPLTNRWSPAGNLAIARTYFQAILLPNGKVLVAGGSQYATAAYNSAELYDPSTNSWGSAGSMSMARLGATMTLLNNGDVLVTGTGWVTELYTPATVPGAPVIRGAYAGNGQATVLFSGPAFDGGSPITGFTVVSNPPGAIDVNAGTTSLDHSVIGLEHGVVYTFTVKATNANGTGLSSLASNSVVSKPDSPFVEAQPSADTWSTQPDIQALAITGPGRPLALNLNSGVGPFLVSGLIKVLSSQFQVPLSFIGQYSTGVVLLGGANASQLAFTPVRIQAGDKRGNGVYPNGSGQYTIVVDGVALTVLPSTLSLEQILLVLPGAIVKIQPNGSILTSFKGADYVVQPDIIVQPGIISSPSLSVGQDGVRFTDSSGNTQRFNPAVLEPDTVRAAVRSIDPNASLSIELDGTATATVHGERISLVPDLILQHIPPERLGQRYWQEGPSRYRAANTELPGTSQGFTAR